MKRQVAGEIHSLAWIPQSIQMSGLGFDPRFPLLLIWNAFKSFPSVDFPIEIMET